MCSMSSAAKLIAKRNVVRLFKQRRVFWLRGVPKNEVPNTLAADALAHCVTRSSEAMVLVIYAIPYVPQGRVVTICAILMLKGMIE